MTRGEIRPRPADSDPPKTRYRETRNAALAQVRQRHTAHCGFFASTPESCPPGPGQFVMEPKPSCGPVAFDRSSRHTKNLSRFLDGQTTEKPQLDNAALLGVQASQVIQGV